MDRPSWFNYFAAITCLVATRSTCPRASVGAIIVKNKRIIATGYNGAPVGHSHCFDAGCEIEDNHCTRVVHAESNALLQAGLEAYNSLMFITQKPCNICANMIKNAGVAEYFVLED